MNQTERLCPWCGNPMSIPTQEEGPFLRAQILALRRRLDELEYTSQPSVQQAQVQPGLAESEQMQERIDKGLQHLHGGYGLEDEP